jgi:D-aminopeptidase
MIAGVPVGRLYESKTQASIGDSDSQLTTSSAQGESTDRTGDYGSIIIIIATDAPLDSRQLNRLSRRAALGLARTGSISHHGSGDFILAFSTANTIPHYPEQPTFSMTHLADTHLNPVLAATVEATEEAILNALLQATTVVGRDDRRVEAISISRLKTIFQSYRGAPDTQNLNDY